ncbi:MAG: hypothetical protein ACON5H_11725 [Akkermansiaceae bacterium]
MKKVLIWFSFIVFLAVGGIGIWFKLRVDEAPTEIEDPGIPGDFDIPEDIPVE